MTFFEKTALFIDAVSLLEAVRALGYEVDFKRLRNAIGGNGAVVRAHYYMTVCDDAQLQACRPLFDWLAYNGFAVTVKRGRQSEDGDRRRSEKRNVAVEIAVDAMEMADRVDHVVLISDDGVLRKLVQSVQRRGVHVTVVSTLKARTAIVADELRRQADTFVDLADLRALVERPQPSDRPNVARQNTADAVPQS